MVNRRRTSLLLYRSSPAQLHQNQIEMLWCKVSSSKSVTECNRRGLWADAEIFAGIIVMIIRAHDAVRKSKASACPEIQYLRKIWHLNLRAKFKKTFWWALWKPRIPRATLVQAPLLKCVEFLVFKFKKKTHLSFTAFPNVECRAMWRTKGRTQTCFYSRLYSSINMNS